MKFKNRMKPLFSLIFLVTFSNAKSRAAFRSPPANNYTEIYALFPKPTFLFQPTDPAHFNDSIPVVDANQKWLSGLSAEQVVFINRMTAKEDVLTITPHVAYFDVNDIPSCWTMLAYNSTNVNQYEGKCSF